MLDLRAFLTGDTIVVDIVAAFAHAEKQQDDIYMWPPKEWYEARGPFDEPMCWHMTGTLYGRRTGASNWRDFFEDVILATPTLQMLRGQSEPTAYRSESSGLVLTHHIDDGRAVGKKVPMDILLAHLAEHVLLKVSEPINAGDAFSYSNRTRIRRPFFILGGNS